ncbi:hypothetical protein [Bacillus cereus group sp. BfR-BA-01538]|uniref:hypothetical protein n=1 Tax=Bacillus cereus group sp. BfR-BA-01538 TaxID=2920373 RepID=UPI001F56AF02
MSNLKEVAIKSKKWLKNMKVSSNKELAQQSIGILFCDQIISPKIEVKKIQAQTLNLPKSPFSLVTMNKIELLELFQSISISNLEQWKVNHQEREQLGKVLGFLAISYANTEDLSVVAALIRAAAHLNLDNHWLHHALIYLIDQQQPDGCFGFITSELAFQGREGPESSLVLRLTIEVLWALAEVSNREQHNLYDSRSSVFGI